MAKKVTFDTSFSFGANAKKPKAKPKGTKGGGPKGGKSDAWRAYTGSK